jgi:hypothetical protein
VNRGLFLIFFNCFSVIFAVFIFFFERGEHATIAWEYNAIQAEHHHHQMPPELLPMVSDKD